MMLQETPIIVEPSHLNALNKNLFEKNASVGQIPVQVDLKVLA